jgi:putative SOS response-associated peptidase YedK
MDPPRRGLESRRRRRGGVERLQQDLGSNRNSVTKGQSAIRDLFGVKHDRAGNLPPLPAIFPDQLAPIVRVTVGGEHELVMARWGMPGPPQYGGQPITNIRNLGSPHWRGWLGKWNRCVVPATSFCEYPRNHDARPAFAPTTGRCLSGAFFAAPAVCFAA